MPAFESIVIKTVRDGFDKTEEVVCVELWLYIKRRIGHF